MTTYLKAPCPFCGTPVSRSGVATYNHRMAHVRRGEAIAMRRPGTAVVMFFNPRRLDDLLADGFVQAEVVK